MPISALKPYEKNPILMALSGGLDSTVLLHAAASLWPKNKIRAIHIHHGLYADADSWQRHCEQLCEGLNVALITVRLEDKPEAGESIEAWAREARYRVFESHLQVDECLLTAHHQQDQAETVLLNLIRGSGPQGLAAMPTSRPLGQGILVRPFLGLSRETLKAYAEQHQLTWVEDPSNENTDFDRNFLRQAVLPLLKTRWPSIEASLTRSAEYAAESTALLATLLNPKLENLRGTQPGTLSIQGLLALDAPQQKALIRQWLSEQGFPLPPYKKLQEILGSVMKAGQDRNPEVTWGQVSIRRYRDDLFVLNLEHTLPLTDYTFEWDGRSELILPHGAGVLTPALLTALGLPPSIYTIIFESVEGKPNKQWFQTQGIPPWQRARLPRLISEGELKGVITPA